MILLKAAIVEFPPHKLVRPPCWYNILNEIKKYYFKLGHNGVTSMPNFTQIRPAVLELR
jgi:hypothetical protein